MNTKEAYKLRADAVYLLRGMGYKLKELAAIFRTTRETIRRLEARGARAFRGVPDNGGGPHPLNRD
jgi:hypothetical protein